MGKDKWPGRTAAEMEQEIKIGCKKFPDEEVMERVSGGKGIENSLRWYWTTVIREFGWNFYLFDRGNTFAFGVQNTFSGEWYLCVDQRAAKDWFWLKVKNPAVRQQKAMWDTFESTEPPVEE